MSKAMGNLMSSITDSPSSPEPVSRGSSQNPVPPLEQQQPSSPTPAGPSRRKRPAEDVTHFAKSIGRSMKIRKTDQTELERFASYGSREQNVWLAAQILKVQEKHEALTPPEVRYDVPRRLATKIEAYSFTIIMDPTIAAYIGPKENRKKAGPANILVEHLRANPDWGLTAAIYDDKPKFEVIVQSISKKFTNRRCDIKTKISESLGDPDPLGGDKRIGVLNIVELCEVLILLYKRGNVQVTVQLCARIAFIRHFFVAKVAEGSNTASFWTELDDELVSVRKMSEIRQSKLFKTILASDRACYGDADLDEVALTAGNADTASNHPGSSTSNPWTTQQSNESGNEGFGGGDDDDETEQ
ncbi:hypothetical protein GALMADRAFT_246474 [Galerina marginata CBS 339.88]|uniref:Uncharacterized protein n=1 Tax=Galerina marginata (strain CBS 339.88) TaxID=685588 RepID=A0A067T221_GALM3|nr:hypothetical protein GALMADRAFT_246474 [Galerina marginata CBS 339.88]